MDYFLKVFFEFITILILFYVWVFCCCCCWPWGMQDLSSLTRDWSCTPCIGRQSLNHWTAKEVPIALCLFKRRVAMNFWLEEVCPNSRCPDSTLPNVRTALHLHHWELSGLGRPSSAPGYHYMDKTKFCQFPSLQCKVSKSDKKKLWECENTLTWNIYFWIHPSMAYRTQGKGREQR